MSSFNLTKRHSRYLSQFKRQRKRLNFFSDDNDIERLRRAEKSYLTLFIFFAFWVLPSIIEGLTSWSWLSYLSILFIASSLYMLYDYYWVSRSVDYMISSSIQNLSEEFTSGSKPNKETLNQSNETQ
jgi:uncharacterized MAPEG superfamily protein